MHHFVSRVMHFIFKCQCLTINRMRNVCCLFFSLYFHATKTIFIAYSTDIFRSSALTIYYFIGLLYLSPSYAKHKTPMQLQRLSRLTHCKQYTRFEIPIATIHQTIWMDKIASSYPFMRFFYTSFARSPQFTMEIIYEKTLRVHCFRVPNHRCVLAQRFKYTLHLCKRCKAP